MPRSTTPRKSASKKPGAPRTPRTGEGARPHTVRGAAKARGKAYNPTAPDRVHEIFQWLAAGRTTSRPSGSERSVPKRVVLKITPHKTFTWDHTKLGGRY